MNKLMLKGDWNTIKGRVKSTWGQLTDDDLTRVEGDWEQLVGAIQKRTGQAKEAVERELAAVLEGMEDETRHVARPGDRPGPPRA